MKLQISFKYLIKYKEIKYYHMEVRPGIETTHATVKMKVKTLPVDLELLLFWFLVQHHGSFVWNSSELGRKNLIQDTVIVKQYENILQLTE